LTHKVLQIIKGDKNGTSQKTKGATKVPKGSSSKLLEKSSGNSKGAIKGPKGPSKKAPGNGTLMGLMGRSKRPKTKVVIKGTKRTLVKASSLKRKITNRT